MNFSQHIFGNITQPYILLQEKRLFHVISTVCIRSESQNPPEWLDECFLNRTTRRISRDATLELDCRCYDAPMQLIGQKVEVRYLPDDPEKVWVFSEGKRYQARLTNRIENGKTKRENQVAIDYSTVLGGGKNVH